jgi:hypothetical protein
MKLFLVVTAFAVLASVIAIYLILRSDAFVRAYCLRLFQDRQKLFLAQFNNQIANNIEKKEEIQSAMIEALQDHLWNRSKKLDDNISKRIFNLELILDIAYIVWLIYFVHENYDGSKS